MKKLIVLAAVILSLFSSGCVRTVYRYNDGNLKAVSMTRDGVEGIWIPNARIRQMKYSCDEIELTIKEINRESKQ